MSVYQKLNDARKALHSKGLKMSGKNKFADYEYFDLCDFIPAIVNICSDAGIIPLVSFTDLVGTMEIVDVTDGTKILFTSPMSTAQLKGCHPVQNLGAVETYVRRYLYQVAFEIVEHDALNSSHGRDDDRPNQRPTQARPNQRPQQAPQQTQKPMEQKPIPSGNSFDINIDLPEQEGPESFQDDPIDNTGTKKFVGIIPEAAFEWRSAWGQLLEKANNDADYLKETLKNLGVSSAAGITYDIYKKALAYVCLPSGKAV